MNSASIAFDTNTSFAQLFEASPVRRIQIPLIQRDYAQGRPGEEVERIRERFLDALYQAVTVDGAGIKLDFIYGDQVGDAFHPLDGQQRLTTLFLLHWYLAWRADVPLDSQTWTHFTYDTRDSARMFCERLVKVVRPGQADIRNAGGLSGWLRDQPWYFYTWEHDPTIQAMLMMLDALHARFGDCGEDGCRAAWARLVDAEHPAIGFYLLPIPAEQTASDLYIKMNSRGKPLTEFENFKAQFIESLKAASHPEARVSDFAFKVDTAWSDILWRYRGDDHLIDDEFMRYFRFIAELHAWVGGVAFDAKTRLEDLAASVYAQDLRKATPHLEFLFQSFDIWQGEDIRAWFEARMTATPGGPSVPLLLFNAFGQAPRNESPVDLFAACCRSYGAPGWTFAHSLLLYATLLHRIHKTPDFPCRLRRLRNLIEASLGGEIRADKMPDLLADVKAVVVDHKLTGIAALNQAQVANEAEKTALLDREPTLADALHGLEDHDLLRGRLTAFDLDPAQSASVFQSRAQAFQVLFNHPDLWKELTGALLALGDYSRQWDRWNGYRMAAFGAASEPLPWRYVFGGGQPNLVVPLMALLDRVAHSSGNIPACLATLQQEFLRDCEVRQPDQYLDWRYYFVKYPAMREGASGRYAIKNSGYGACMLDKTRMSSFYRDPYLYAMWELSGVGDDPISKQWPWFYGYETESRRMALKASGLKIECVDQGWQLSDIPADPVQLAALNQVFAQYGIQNNLCPVRQAGEVDSEDRIALGAGLLKALVQAKL
ncbi:Uncharacterized conserved protein, contains ParB-like and HNH nuclease domains [Methylomagnum ishizawai]|uniref:Uncharacterized conserved protein, contains ParB-like and HNH nuclease domains n=1 Tax=Methylomagnum ishizawai TaxID=1760988 RepID=A0A1Y6D1C8_9GAMM|nr:DUF262 domain-containing protein [Methylomagnum ishizawai]SMF94372.1 Uncharacterized conserved protein, contains ParB-like and HNH nuclease domains [Methylomagnum ishizawai]